MNIAGRLLVCALSIVFVSTTASAGVSAYESFDYVSGELLGKDGGTGFSGEWLQYDGAPVLDNWEIAEGSLSFPGLQTEGNRATSEVLFGDSWVGLLHELDAPTTGTTTKYVSFLVRPEGTIDEGSFAGAFGVVLSGMGGQGDLYIGNPGAISDYAIDTFFDEDIRSSGIPVISGATSLIVVKAELSGGDDTFTLFVNPTPGDSEPLTGTIKDDLDIGAVTGVGIVAGGAVSVDELRWGDSFADVTPTDMPPLPGDVNGDEAVDLLDFGIIRDNMFVTGATLGEGDLTLNGIVNFEDFRLWKGIFNGAAAVPEPAGITLLGIGLFGSLAAYARRTR